MLGDASIMAFVATTDAARAREFYEDVLGLRFVAEEEYALVFDANGTMLRIQRVQDLTPQVFTALGWQVDDIAATMQELVAKGVTFESFGLPGQDATGALEASGFDSDRRLVQRPGRQSAVAGAVRLVIAQSLEAEVGAQAVRLRHHVLVAGEELRHVACGQPEALGDIADAAFVEGEQV